MKNAPTDQTSVWSKTPFANLVRYEPSGRYFARFRVHGKLIRKSLKTKTLTVAKLRLADLERQERGVSAVHVAVEQGRLTFNDALKTYQAEIKASPRLKPNAIRYRNETVNALLRTWAGLKEKDVRKISEAECKAWAAKFSGEYSATLYNNTVGTLRQVLAIAIKAGAIYNNPAQAVSKAKIRTKELRLPEPEQFAKFITVIAAGGARQSRDCASLVQFLAYGGFRKGEAANVAWNDCDFTKEEIVVRGDPVHGTKSGATRRVPMIPEMVELLKALELQRDTGAPNQLVMGVHECQNAMNRAAKLVGMTRTATMLAGSSEPVWQRQLRAAIAVELALWDTELCTQACGLDLGQLIQPTTWLAAFAHNCGWDLEVAGATSLFGRTDQQREYEGRPRNHSAWLALQGRVDVIERRVWQAQLTVLFPLLENHRQELLSGNKSEWCVPWKTTFGFIESLEDLELNHLADQLRANRFIGNGQRDLFDFVCWLRDIRNDLAHLVPVSSTRLLNHRFEPRFSRYLVGDD